MLAAGGGVRGCVPAAGNNAAQPPPPAVRLAIEPQTAYPVGRRALPGAATWTERTGARLRVVPHAARCPFDKLRVTLGRA